MKKLVFMFVAVAAISFASCGQQAQPAQVDTDTIEEVVDSVIDSIAADTDTVAADTVAAAE
jgi:hypothetical protein